MAQLVICVPHTHGDLKSDPQNPQGKAKHGPLQSLHCKDGDRRVLWVCCPTPSHLIGELRISQRACLKN